jgi:hypothetical protein
MSTFRFQPSNYPRLRGFLDFTDFTATSSSHFPSCCTAPEASVYTPRPCRFPCTYLCWGIVSCCFIHSFCASGAGSSATS